VQFETRVHDVQQLIAQMSAIPGVNAVAASHWIPLSNAYLSVPVNVPGTASTQYQAGFNPVTPAYFRALRIPLIAGRSFTQSDSLHARPVAIVSEQFARAHFGNAAAALGQTVRPQMDIGLNSTPARTIVGVVGDIRVSHGTPPQPSVYVPFSQFPLAFAFVIRSDARVAGIAPAVDRIFSRYDPQGAPPLLVPYTAVSATDTRDSGTAAMLFGVFAIVALALALAGIYAVTAYSVEQRTQEFGIRRAIGATKAAVVRTVLTATLVHALAGAAIGVTLPAFSARWFSALLYATSAFEPEALAAAIAIMLFCTMLAALVPALRAAHMQPNKALRYE
jgi:ABC-type antimicrobial peptide transport system permease subunit